MIKKRDEAWKKYIQFKSTANFEQYKSIRNIVNSMVRADGAAYRKSLLQGFKSNPKKFYGYMRNLRTVKDAATTLRRSDGSTTATDQETAAERKQQYRKVFVSEPAYVSGDPHPSSTQQHDGIIKFDTATVLRYLQRLRPDSSPGPDGLHPLLFVNCAAAMAEPLSIIFPKSDNSGNLPHDWKTANIVPIYRKGDRADRNN